MTGQYDALVAMDRSIKCRQRIATLPFGIVLVRAPSNRMQGSEAACAVGPLCSRRGQAWPRSAGRSLMDDEQPRGKVSADTTILTFWYILIYCMDCSALYEGARLLMNGRFAPGLSFEFAVSGEC
jgi:hypothetical protein